MTKPRDQNGTTQNIEPKTNGLVQKIIELSEDEQNVLKDNQRRARSMYVLSERPLREIADELTNIEGIPGCSESHLRKYSMRFKWTAIRKQVRKALSGGAAEVIAKRKTERVLAAAAEMDMGDEIPETLPQINLKHFRVGTKLLDAAARSLEKYEDGMADEIETIKEEDARLSSPSKGGAGSGSGESSGIKKKTRTKGYTGFTPTHLGKIAEVAQKAVAIRRQAAGLEDSVKVNVAYDKEAILRDLRKIAEDTKRPLAEIIDEWNREKDLDPDLIINIGRGFVN